MGYYDLGPSILFPQISTQPKAFRLIEIYIQLEQTRKDKVSKSIGK